VLLARIVKSIAVVDDRQRKPEPMAMLEATLSGRKVLKNHILDGFGYTLQNRNAPAYRDDIVEEINRLKLEAEEEKASLRKLRQQVREAEEELKQLSESKVDAAIVDDEIYNQRVAEIEAKVAAARQQSQELRESAEAEGKKIRDKAQKEGYKEGYAKGYAAAEEAFREESTPKLNELAYLVDELSGYGDHLMARRENEFIQLAVAVAGKIVARELKLKPATVVDILREFVHRNQRETYITISLSPDMLPVSVKACEEVIETLQNLCHNVTVYVEKEAAPGTLILETPKGVTDMSVDTQLANIQEALLAPDEE
jgi:flagellar assembly protein FliH